MGLRGAKGPIRAEPPAGQPWPLRVEGRLPARPDLPAGQTSFIGRALELAELADLLAAPACRLVTIIGPGGIGKTRLALEAAAAARDAFADGVAFAPLAAVATADAVAPALAAALGCPLAGREDARDQVVRYLRPTRLLLVLDNVEHLLDEAPWLGELLAAAPGLRLLVTSRAALNLREEWRYPLAGLAVPDEGTDDPKGAEGTDAVRLFAERARQVRPDFSLAAERDGALRLCRIAEGLPLALELAAAWVAILPCDAIADEIVRNLDLLATTLRNVPERHRSVRAAFGGSWALLTEGERAVFTRLALFRGGFTREAAERVVGATLPTLSALVGKSLLRREADGRFGLHELLRQYAEEHLAVEPAAAASAAAAHRDYYLAFVAARSAAIAGGGQREAVAALATELDNIRAAWRSAVAAGDVAALGRVAHTLTLFHDFRARYREGLALLGEGLPILRAEASPEADRALAAVLVDMARFHHRLGQLPAMRVALSEAVERYDRVGGPPPPGLATDPLVWRGILALTDGHYAEAAQLGAASVRRNTDADRPGNLSPAWWVQGAAALWQEDLDAAGEYARRCTEAALAVGDHWYLAYGHNQQGHVAVARGDYTEAQRHYAASHAIRAELDDPEGMATALAHLAKVAALQGATAEAEELYQRALAIAREIGDQSATANALNGLGATACAGGDYVVAGRHFAEGLHLMAEARLMRHLLVLLTSVGDWLLLTGRAEEAAIALALARDHPASDHETRARAGHLLATAATALPPGTYAAAAARGRGDDPVELAVLLVPLLTAPLVADRTHTAPGDAATPAPPAPTRDAATAHAASSYGLTPREADVLRLLAEGLTDHQIGARLFISRNTVASHTRAIFGKLGVTTRAAAARLAAQHGLA